MCMYLLTWKCWCHLWPVVEIFNPQNILHTTQWKMSLTKYVLINNHLTTHLIYTYTISAPRYQIEFNGTWFWTGMHIIYSLNTLMSYVRGLCKYIYHWNQVLDSRRYVLGTFHLQIKYLRTIFKEYLLSTSWCWCLVGWIFSENCPICDLKCSELKNINSWIWVSGTYKMGGVCFCSLCT